MADDDPIARLRAEMDQAREGMRELAGNVWSFYNGARDAGFSDAQAFRLTRDMVAASFGRSYEADEDDE